MSIEEINTESLCRQGCGYGKAKGFLYCLPTGDGCGRARLLEADESDFHDQYMSEATKAFNSILNLIPADSQGREISFIHTNMGTLLAWVDHTGKVITPEVSDESTDTEIADALGLQGFGAKGATQAY